MSAVCVAFSFGFLMGTIIFDQAWRYVNRLRDRLAREIAASARSGGTPKSGPTEGESAVGNAETPKPSRKEGP